MSIYEFLDNQNRPFINSYEDDMDMYDLYCQNKTNEVYSEGGGGNNNENL